MTIPETGDEGYCRVCGQWCKYPYPGYYRDAVCSKECFNEWQWRDTLHILRKPYYPKPAPPVTDTPDDPAVDARKSADVLLNAPLDRWIALSADESRMVAVGETFEEAVANAEKAGVLDPVLIKVPEDWTPRTFSLPAPPVTGTPDERT